MDNRIFEKESEQRHYLKNNDLPHLSNLLTQLSEKSYKQIRGQKKLIESLVKLYNVVGMKSIKESIAKQTSYLIGKLESEKFSMKMLSSCVYGAPGVGKTKIGIIMAEIWYHLGFLQKAVEQKDSKQGYLSYLSLLNSETIQIYMFFGIILLTKLYEVVQPLYYKYGFSILLIIVALVAALLYSFLSVYETEKKLINENNFITVVSRSSFVAEYVGHTSIKTEKLLNDNRGKVIFIDEAYSLYTGPYDSFGMESLTALNKYMSEHEDEIVIIFAGYEELMKETIFKAQPGLNRRCMWQFNCTTYEPEELYQIYLQQLKKDNLEIYQQDAYKIEDYIIDNADLFVNQGGDCEKLSFFSQLSKSSRDDHSPYISYLDVKNGIKELKLNNINKITKPEPTMQDFIKKMQEVM